MKIKIQFASHFVLLLTCVNLFGQVVLIDSGKIELYAKYFYEDFEKTEGTVWILLDEERSTAQKVLQTSANIGNSLTAGGQVVYFVDSGDGSEAVKELGGYKDQFERWFEDDPDLLKFIKAKNLNQNHLTLLVKMYNHHMPRPFDNGFSSGPISTFHKQKLTDPRDNQSYDIIEIEQQAWMAQDLRYDTECPDCPKEYRSYCFDCTEKGAFYTWRLAINVCPGGWRLPSEADYHELLVSAGLPIENVAKIFGMDKDGNTGKKLITGGSVQLNLQKGGFVKNGKLKYEYIDGNYWTASEYLDKKMNNAHSLWVKKDGSLAFTYYKKDVALKVRCVTNIEP